MTPEELRECIDIAKRFAKIYRRFDSGLIGVSCDLYGNPRVHIRYSTFMELYGGGTFETHIDKDGDKELRKMVEGVTVFALAPKGEV